MGINEGLARGIVAFGPIRAAAIRDAVVREVAVPIDKSGRTSAGILLWRRRNDRLEVLLAHMGGPHWVDKDLGHWTIPKGEVEAGEELVAVARREFTEETGHELPDTPLIELGEIRQKSGKLVLAWAAQGDLDAATAVSNTYQMEWPPGSGRLETFPEIDRVEWFKLKKARRKLKAAQVPFLDRLQAAIAVRRELTPRCCWSFGVDAAEQVSLAEPELYDHGQRGDP